MKIKAGAASAVIDVPLFTELYGYGPFLGRRNRGINDSLYCRAGSFFDGKKRIVIISNDLVTMSRSAAQEIRSRLSTLAEIYPDGIMVCGSHTHSGPTISHGIGWGELDVKFKENWIELAIQTAVKAINDEEEVNVSTGKSPLKEKLGYNRVFEDGPTDADIRWVKFKRADESVKLLMHNHAMHGVVFGPEMLMVSADWIGAANRLILKRKIAENVIFLQGAEGNINTSPACLDYQEGLGHLKRISESYLDSLQVNLDAENDIDSNEISFVLEETVLPHSPLSVDSLKETADALIKKMPERTYLINRFQEMALYMEAGNSIGVKADLQVLKIGNISIYAIPGEPFIQLGEELMEKTPGFGMVAALANGNCRYFPDKQTFEKYPSLFMEDGFGFYEIHQGCGRFMPKYVDDIAEILVNKILDIGAI
jgi:hypothetical protein